MVEEYVCLPVDFYKKRIMKAEVHGFLTGTVMMLAGAIVLAWVL